MKSEIDEHWEYDLITNEDFRNSYLIPLQSTAQGE